VPHIRRIGEEKPDEGGEKNHPACRWVVERTIAWLQICRALLVRYDKKAENTSGPFHLRAALPRHHQIQALNGRCWGNVERSLPDRPDPPVRVGSGSATDYRTLLAGNPAYQAARSGAALTCVRLQPLSDPAACVANSLSYGQTDEMPPLHEAVAWRLAFALGDPWQGMVTPCVLRD